MSEIIIYEDADGQSAVQVRLDGETVWLTQDQMAFLFDRSAQSSPNISGIYLRTANWPLIQFVQILHILQPMENLPNRTLHFIDCDKYMNLKSLDEKYMRMALRLAEKARGRTSPNPMVGAVVVKGGKVIAAAITGRLASPMPRRSRSRRPAGRQKALPFM